MRGRENKNLVYLFEWKPHEHKTTTKTEMIEGEQKWRQRRGWKVTETAMVEFIIISQLPFENY